MSNHVFILRVVDGPAVGRQVVLDGSVTVGRGSVDLDLDDPSVSREHARVGVEGDGVYVEDLGSTGGTSVDGQDVKGRHPIRKGSRIRVGRSRVELLRYRPSRPLASVDGDPTLVSSSGAVHALPADAVCTIGRDPAQVDALLPDSTVSRVHARVRRDGDQPPVLEVLSARSPTSVNGVRVDHDRRLADGDVLQFGTASERLTVRLPGGAQGSTVGVQVSARLEGRGGARAIDVEAGGVTEVGSVLDAVAEVIGIAAASPEGSWFAYTSAGELLDRESPWVTAPVRRGEEIVLATLHHGDRQALVDAAVPVTVTPTSRRLLVNQLPRTHRPPVVVKPILPDIPEGTSLRGRGIVWQVGAGLAGAVGGVVIASVTGRIVFGLIFAAVALTAVTAAVLGDQSRRRFRQRTFDDRLGALDRELGATVVAQRDALAAVSPAVEELLGWVAGPGERLWERRVGDGDFLTVRVGRSPRSAFIDSDDSWQRSSSPVAPRLGEVLERHRVIPEAPFTIDRVQASVVGLVGDAESARALARSFVLQSAFLHSPQDLTIAVIVPDGEWAWLRWLPHAEIGGGALVSWDEESAGQVGHLVEGQMVAELEQTRSSRDADARPKRLVLMTADALTADAARGICASAGVVGDQVIVVGSDARSLPPEVVVQIECSATSARVSGSTLEAAVVEVVPEYLDRGRAEAAVRGLAPFRDPRTEEPHGLPEGGLLGLLGFESLDALDVDVLWRATGDHPLRAPVGVRDDGQPLAVSFRENGPHALLAGTTGSGKSVFLQTMLAALALTHSPETLNLFLIDYKGSATFGDLGVLPHTVGLVTDLEGDRSLTVRALTSLDAELRRRKELFSRAGNVEKLSEYERLPIADEEPLPSLLVVIDEYAAFASDPQNEEAVKRLNNVAIQGRSLGVHMLLAMQSPQGVVSNAVQKNTNMWICLRVVQAEESVTVIGKADAAQITDQQPGRGYFRLGGSDLITGFQTAMLDTSAEHGPAVVVRPFADRGMARAMAGEAPPSAPGGGSGDRPLRDLCSRLVVEADRLDLREQRKLWLPPLPTSLQAEPITEGERKTDRLEALLGLADFPERQAQELQYVDLSAVGNVLVIGEFGAGKSTALCQVVIDLADRLGPENFHLYAIDAGAGSLGPLQDLPSVAAIVAADDTERLGRVLDRITREAEGRRELLASSGQGNWLQWRAATDPRPPWIVLVVDDFPVFKETAEEFQFGRLLEQLASLLQGGPQVGIHVVLATTQRTDMRSTMVNLFGELIVLRQRDSADYDMGGLRGAASRDYSPNPGRALMGSRGGCQMQIFHPRRDDLVDVATSQQHVDRDRWPRPVERLPKEISFSTLIAAGARPTSDSLVLGIGGPEVEPVVFDHVRLGPHLLVLGEDVSGKSTTLATCFQSAVAGREDARVGVVTCRTSPLSALAESPEATVCGRSPEEIAELLAQVEGDPTFTHLLVDDVELLPTEAAPRLEGVLRSARERDLRCVLSARSSDLIRVYDGWARYLLSLKIGLILMPTAEMAAMLDVRMPKDAAPMLPGRGYLVARGAMTTLQVAGG